MYLKGKAPLMHENIQLLPAPSTPCPQCGSKEFLIWKREDDPTNQAISCNACGAVIASTHPLADDDRPIRVPRAR
jgi:uncharacterized Zn finger protein